MFEKMGVSTSFPESLLAPRDEKRRGTGNEVAGVRDSSKLPDHVPHGNLGQVSQSCPKPKMNLKDCFLTIGFVFQQYIGHILS